MSVMKPQGIGTPAPAAASKSLRHFGDGIAALVGRDGDLKRICEFLGSPDGGRALLLSGDPGVGKTVLLQAAAADLAAGGARVLHAAGVEFEADVSYSGLNQILFPLREDFDELDFAHRDALRVALGFGTGSPPDRLIISNATMVLLQKVAADSPLLLVIDDLPWIDRASAAVLGFIARRLSGSRVSFLGGARLGTGRPAEFWGLPEFELLPLDEDSAATLVNSRFPGLAGGVRRRLLAAAQGNPLALLELPAALKGAQRSALEDLPSVWPLSQRLQTLFVSRVAGLPPSTQRLLLLATLEASGQLGVLQKAAREMGEEADLDDLSPAERDQLVEVDAGTRRLTFRHPLIRSAVVQLSTASERLFAHRVLALVLADDPERRAWHLGEACLEPDEQVAGLLVKAAHHRVRRGDAVGAAAALTRAADLSPHRADRGRRLAEAAYIGADAAGALRSASELLEGARRADPDLSDSLHCAAAAVHLILNDNGDIDTAHRLLVEAIERGVHGYDANDKALVDTLHLLLLISFFGGRKELWDPFYAALARMRPRVPALLAVTGKTFSDPARMGTAVLEQLETVLNEERGATDPVRLVRLGTASLYADRLSDVREASWRVVRMGRDGGPARQHIGGLMHLCLDGYLTGMWDEVVELADEGLQVCRDFGYKFFTWYFLYSQAIIAAARGDAAASSALAEQITRWAVSRGVGVAAHYAGHCRVLTCLGSGDFEGAYRHASAISPAGTLGSHVPHALWVTMDMVEAAVHTNRPAEAAAHVQAMREAGIAALSPRLAQLAGGSAALCAVSDDEAVRLFEETLSLPLAGHWPFDLARVQLAYGERLRRARATAQSRGPLGSALSTFERLGARMWAERASKELRAAGGTGTDGGGKDRQVLTPQEMEIALLAGSGLTNKQIGERLFLSHRTVGAHLYQIFPKLGVTSRAALGSALAYLGQGTHSSSPDAGESLGPRYR
jgi:DNA-binding CsgD family transcriptional regulator